MALCSALCLVQRTARSESYVGLEGYAADTPYQSGDIDDGDWLYEPADGCYLTRPPARFGTAVFDVLILNRSRADHANLVRENAGGAIVLNSSGLPLSAGSGFRFKWTSDSDCGTDLQFIYLGSHDLQTSATVTGTDLRGLLFGSSASTGGPSLTTNYESLLDSGEINLRTRQWRNIAPIAGLRVLQVEDSILHTSAAGVGSAMCDNELYGFQLGFEGVVFQQGRWSVEGIMKAGVFYNNLDVMMNTANIDFTRHFHQTSFIGEASLFMRYRLAQCLSFYAGYQGLWLDGVALIPDQFDNFSPGPSPVQGRADLTTVEYHGGLIGFEATW